MKFVNAFFVGVFSLLVSVSSFAGLCVYSSSMDLVSLKTKAVSYALDPKIALENFVKDSKNPVLQIKTKNANYLKEDAQERTVPKYILDRMSRIVELWLEIRPTKTFSWLDNKGIWLEKHPEKVLEIDVRLYEQLIDTMSFLISEVGSKKHSLEETQGHVDLILSSLFGDFKNQEATNTTHFYLMNLIHESITDSRTSSLKPSFEVDKRLENAKSEELSFSQKEMELALRVLIDRR